VSWNPELITLRHQFTGAFNFPIDSEEDPGSSLYLVSAKVSKMALKSVKFWASNPQIRTENVTCGPKIDFLPTSFQKFRPHYGQEIVSTELDEHIQ
jgi:hypothetical protein